MDEAFHNAVKRKKQLEAELLEVETFLSLYPKFSGNGFEASAAIASNRVDATPVDSLQPTTVTEGQLRPHARRGAPDQIASIVQSILMSHNRPMTRGELADEMVRIGFPIPAKDKAKYLGTILWRKSDLFENLEGKGYWLRGIPVEKNSRTFFLKHSAALADSK